ncbi:MAG TPA: ABC transporter ATP-binding protein [Candidatus Aquilonibacter sp.]|nr:ABC transporter ATP-binding protein [Candidatus Aquilonibacter sp.]
MIALQDLTIAAGGRTLVREIDAAIAPGEFVAVLGPNGVGKTTLLRTIAGILRPADGAVCVAGAPLKTLTAVERARAIAYVTSDDVLAEALRVRDVVSIGRFPYHSWWQWRSTVGDDDAIAQALADVHMTPYADRLFGTLSSGERQRVWIAMGLAQATPAILLDEPTSHLDVRVAHEILSLLRGLARAGRAILCVLHDLNDAAAYADRLMLLGCERMLACSTPSDVLVPDLIEAAYGIGVERIDTASGPRIFANVAL